MLHDTALVDRLSGFATQAFDDAVFRATRLNFDPLAFSTRGGRWAPDGLISVLNTSQTEHGALAEISYHWSQLTPLPTKPVALHRLHVRAKKVVRLTADDLKELGVDLARLGELDYDRTREIGAVVAFLGSDGLLVPSARWDCENLVLFSDDQVEDSVLSLVESRQIDWREWARENGFLA